MNRTMPSLIIPQSPKIDSFGSSGLCCGSPHLGQRLTLGFNLLSISLESVHLTEAIGFVVWNYGDRMFVFWGIEFVLFSQSIFIFPPYLTFRCKFNLSVDSKIWLPQPAAFLWLPSFKPQTNFFGCWVTSVIIKGKREISVFSMIPPHAPHFPLPHPLVAPVYAPIHDLNLPSLENLPKGARHSLQEEEKLQFCF